MKLYLCEKPSQARDIGRVLGVTGKGEGCLRGDSSVVTWCFGHLLKMAPPDAYDLGHKQWTLKSLPIIPAQWKLEVKKQALKQYRVIQKLLKETRHVVIATDADREGESIAREVLDLCHWQGTLQRLWLAALDDASIRKALDNIFPGEQTEPLYRAGLGRARADWLVGMNLTRAYTLLGRQAGYSNVLSVGRVQTPTLSMVVKRDLEIESFKPIPYFDIMARFEAKSGSFSAKWVPSGDGIDDEGRCIDETVARQLSQALSRQTGKVTRADTVREKQQPPLPFDLSALQQVASTKWGMGAQETLKAAQALYETHKALTYPRTDCCYLPESQHEEAKQVLAAIQTADPSYGELVNQAKANRKSKAWNDNKITAHHAIIPTKAAADITRMSESERRLYDLVCRRYIAQFHPAYEYDKTSIEVMVNQATFRTTGHILVVEGWRIVLGKDESDAQDEATQNLPAVEIHEPAKVGDITIDAKQTKPPTRYTEGTLIAAMKSVGKQVDDPQLKKVLRETSGIGTEATRATIIETLFQREYLKKQEKHLISTEMARNLIAILPDEIKNPTTTALWEQGLDDIAQNRGDLDSFIEQQIAWLNQILTNASIQPEPVLKNSTMNSKQERAPCPQCGKPLRRHQGKSGWFWGCSGYPECKTTLPDVKGKPGKATPRISASKPVSSNIGEPCPQCKNGTLVLRSIKSGNNAGKGFVGCTKYPQCRYFAWAE